MYFPFGPFRNSGDFRLWIVASTLWVAVASALAFYVEPSQPTNPPAPGVLGLSGYGRADEICLGRSANLFDRQQCADDERRAAARADGRQVPLRVGIIVLPPFVVVGMIWLVASAADWVRRGYAK
jgi:hypothetical protein